MAKLHYDNSKDLYEGLITEEDEGVWSQVAWVMPRFRKEYGFKFAASQDMYEALKEAWAYLAPKCHEPRVKVICDKIGEALAKAERENV